MTKQESILRKVDLYRDLDEVNRDIAAADQKDIRVRVQPTNKQVDSHEQTSGKKG